MDRNMTRRRLLKVGAAGGTAAAVGGGAQTGIVPEDYQLTGDADALVISGTAAVVGAVAIAGVSAGVTAWVIGGDTSLDPEEVIEDQIYLAANSVAEGRAEFEEEMTTMFVDRATDATPYADAAWSEIRATTVKDTVNGASVAEVETAALDALDYQTTLSIINMAERWNTGVDGLMEALVEQFSDASTTVLDTADSDYFLQDLEPDIDEDIQPLDPVEASQVNEDTPSYAVYEMPLTPPTPVSEIEGRDEEPRLLGIAGTYGPSTNHYGIGPGFPSEWTGVSVNFQGNQPGPIEASHSDLETRTILDMDVYNGVINAIHTEYNNIKNQIPDYVSSIHGGITEGSLDPATIIGPQQIADEFSDTDQMQRIAGELLAVGAETPSEYGYRAEVSHAELESESLWGWLFPMFGEAGDPVSLTPGTTLTSDQYEMAYFVYESAVDGSLITKVLAGDSDLTVHQLDEVEGQETVDPEVTGDTSEAGEVTVWKADVDGEPPEALANPSEHSGWSVVVHGATNESVHSVTDVQESSGRYYLASTDLNDGEAVEAIEIVPSVDYEDGPVRHVADPTDVSAEDEQALIDELRETNERLKEELNDGGDGGFAIPGIGLPAVGGGIGGLLILGGLGWVFFKNRGKSKNRS